MPPPRSLPVLSELDESPSYASHDEPDGYEPAEPLADRAAAALGRGGAIARGLVESGARFEERAGQIEMARAIAEVIEAEQVLLCEAGTGIGKTLAYLVPALLSGRRVVVSTATKALQEQIFTKDLPLLAALLGVPVRAALMKGLANYLCRRRLREAFTAVDQVSGERARAVIEIAEWARSSETGDRAELSALRDDDPAWHDVQSGSDTRIGVGCDFYDSCFVTRMRDEAQRARLVVVNHHLYLADLALRKGGARQGVIPDHDVVIFDEAHQLEEIGTEFFGVRVSTARLDVLVRDARRSAFLARGRSADSPLDVRLFQATLDRIAAGAQRFFAQIAARHPPSREGSTRVPLSPDFWTDEAVDASRQLDGALEALAAATARFDSARFDSESASPREDVAGLGRRAQSFRNDLARVAAPGRDDVPWIEVRARSCAIGVSPLDLAPIFRDELFGAQRRRTTILTSATLAAGPSFAHARRRLGLSTRASIKFEGELDGDEFDVDRAGDGFDGDECDEPRNARAVSTVVGREVSTVLGREVSTVATRELLVPSPFDFRKNAGVYVPLDLPEPAHPDFLAAASARIVELLQASRGGAFVLCASTRNMHALHRVLQQAHLPHPVYCQGERPKTTLLEEFRAAGDAVLVATMGFWEGVDVRGDALRLVVIDKLPFAVPTDPVVAARHRAIEAEGRSSFAERSVPDAAIALKQGFGRLIRTSDDVGVVAILDRRLRTRGYGRTLRASLPPASPLHDLDDVRRFFDVVVGANRAGSVRR